LEDQPKGGGMPAIEEPVVKKVTEKDEKDLTKKSTEELKELLKGAIDSENYERASRIRDELNKRKKS
jgi:protein-arginine kinase activator protein McsA